MNHLLKVAMATAASTLRGWQGMVVTEPAVVQPEKPLKLFERQVLWSLGGLTGSRH